MNLARHSITETTPVQIFDTRFDVDNRIFTTSTPSGFAVYRTWPLKLLQRTNGTLAAVVPLHTSSLLFLLGGGRSPLYPPNKVVLWDDALGKEIAELEFRERVRGVACRRGWLAVALRRRVVVFEIAESISRYAEWDTCENERGLLAIATAAYSTLLAIPGRQMGHVQLIHLPPCRPPVPVGPPASVPPARPPPAPAKHPVSIVIAHTTALTTLSVPASGRLLATTSSRGTLIRIWDSQTGKLVREFRRGTDKAEIYGVAFRPDEAEICVWSDKGTVHVFGLGAASGSSNRQSTFSPLTPFLPLPKYFDSEWSYAQYRIPTQSSHITLSSNAFRSADSEIPEEERCVVGWIEAPPDSATSESGPQHQLVALTFTGGWHRLSLPPSSASASGSVGAQIPSGFRNSSSAPRTRSLSGSSFTNRSDKGKEKEVDKQGKESRDCVLREFRRYGRWDGWG